MPLFGFLGKKNKVPISDTGNFQLNRHYNLILLLSVENNVIAK